MTKDLLLFIRRGMEVQRFHTVPTIRENLVGHHSCGVAWNVWLLTEGKCSTQLILSALAHDLYEQHSGDIPAPFKRASGMREQLQNSESKYLADLGFEFQLSKEESRILKLADSLDGAIFCAQERAMGNYEITPVFKNFMSYIMIHHPLSEREQRLVDLVWEIWESANG